MITYSTSKTEKDLLGILALQKINLPINLSAEEITKEGFVTISHSFEELKKMNAIEQHIVAKEDDNVIAYLLAMTSVSKKDIPVLIPMFEKFDSLKLNGEIFSSYHYIVVGQVCVAKDYRGQGILNNCYQAYKNRFSKKYDLAVTDINTKNLRSINAHKKIGFFEIDRFIASDNEEWSIVVWEW